LIGPTGNEHEKADLLEQLARIDKLADKLARTQADSVGARTLVERMEREMTRAHGALKTLLWRWKRAVAGAVAVSGFTSSRGNGPSELMTAS
jgi:hypothetical protein